MVNNVAGPADLPAYRRLAPLKLRALGAIIVVGGGVQTHSVVINDVRGDDRYLRVTWHPETHVLVFSHWDGSLCRASTPVRLGDAAKVVELVVRGLREALEGQPDRSATGAGREDWLSRVRRTVKPSLAKITVLMKPKVQPRLGPRSGMGNRGERSEPATDPE